MKRLLVSSCALALVAGLSACGEKPQTATPRKSDQKAWAGADNPYGVASWKAGDQTSWEEQIRTRAQAQNEYNKAK